MEVMKEKFIINEEKYNKEVLDLTLQFEHSSNMLNSSKKFIEVFRKYLIFNYVINFYYTFRNKHTIDNWKGMNYIKKRMNLKILTRN